MRARVRARACARRVRARAVGARCRACERARIASSRLVGPVRCHSGVARLEKSFFKMRSRIVARNDVSSSTVTNELKIENLRGGSGQADGVRRRAERYRFLPARRSCVCVGLWASACVCIGRGGGRFYSQF